MVFITLFICPPHGISYPIYIPPRYLVPYLSAPPRYSLQVPPTVFLSGQPIEQYRGGGAEGAGAGGACAELLNDKAQPGRRGMWNDAPCAVRKPFLCSRPVYAPMVALPPWAREAAPSTRAAPKPAASMAAARTAPSPSSSLHTSSAVHTGASASSVHTGASLSSSIHTSSVHTGAPAIHTGASDVTAENSGVTAGGSGREIVSGAGGGGAGGGERGTLGVLLGGNEGGGGAGDGGTGIGEATSGAIDGRGGNMGGGVSATSSRAGRRAPRVKAPEPPSPPPGDCATLDCVRATVAAATSAAEEDAAARARAATRAARLPKGRPLLRPPPPPASCSPFVEGDVAVSSCARKTTYNNSAFARSRSCNCQYGMVYGTQTKC